MKIGNEILLNMDAMQLSRDKPMIVLMIVDVLQSRISFILPTSVRLSMNYTLLTTERNGAKLEFENFTYTKKCNNENTEITTRKCTDRRCKGTGKPIEGSFEFLLTNPRYHEANPAKKLVKIEKAIESRAIHSLEPPRVVQMSTNNSTGEAFAQMPSQRTMVRRIQRKRVVAHIPNPLSTSLLNVPDDLKTTIGEPFYAFDRGKEDPNPFIIFTTTRNSDELEFSAKWAVDGTFAVCPSLFYQLYTMHGIIKDTTVPLVYCLMRSKTEEKYEELFAALKNLNAMLDPHEGTIDFEIAAIEALKSSFPNANIKGCFFTLHRQIGEKFKVLDWRKNTNKTQTHALSSNLS